jgi:hypothetical protein
VTEDLVALDTVRGDACIFPLELYYDELGIAQRIHQLKQAKVSIFQSV